MTTQPPRRRRGVRRSAAWMLLQAKPPPQPGRLTWCRPVCASSRPVAQSLGAYTSLPGLLLGKRSPRHYSPLTKRDGSKCEENGSERPHTSEGPRRKDGFFWW